MTSDQTFVIVGASLAGAKAAETLREEGFDGRLVLIGAERSARTSARRCRRSTCVARSGARRSTSTRRLLRRPADIELLLGRTAVEPGHVGPRSSRSTTASGCATTGCCSPPGPSRAGSTFPAPSSTASLYLRSVERLRRAARAARPRRHGRRGRRRLDRLRGRRLGAAARARRHDRRPDVGAAGARARPRGGRHLPRHPPRSRRADADGHRRRGVRGRRARSSASAPATGSELDCDFVVVGGRRAAAHRACARRPASPSTTGSSSTSACRRACPASSRPATSPMTQHPFYGERIRVEHWANALNQGPAAARNMLGGTDAYDRCRTSSPTSTTSAWSTRASHRTWDRVVFRGDPASREFIAFWLAGRSRGRGDERQRLGRHRSDPDS